MPTKTDIDRLADRIDRLEMLVRETAAGGAGQPAGRQRARRKANSQGGTTAADTVQAALKSFPDGADLADLQARTGFGEKKLRNIIFRLHKLGRIQRLSRGVYCVK